ncbi:hypothetical protein HOLleu_43246 [Holothuria leucospilota]|uniref:CCHC-type domain-containing protein n=1 Tax=Holothuria leucospilota TaxID=206669 RepID=A0A9Q0YC06_HOLLE|nr:hypothetical protein HOLleu_43246 [Holothuria leucospilota]
MELDRDIPSFFIGGSKSHIRYFRQSCTCFKCGEKGDEARSCPNEVRCNLCGDDGHVSGSCSTSYSAHVGTDVDQAPEPSQTGSECSTQELEEAAQVEQDFLASKECGGGGGWDS